MDEQGEQARSGAAFTAPFPHGTPSKGDVIEIPLKDGSTVDLLVGKVVWRLNENDEYVPSIHIDSLADESGDRATPEELEKKLAELGLTVEEG